jgi:hypothetical protein
VGCIKGNLAVRARKITKMIKIQHKYLSERIPRARRISAQNLLQKLSFGPEVT